MDQPAALAPFELSGGCLCLDFVNTWADRERPETDQLGSLDQVWAFGRQTGFLGAAEAGALSLKARMDPGAAEAALGRARVAREAIYRLCSDRAAGRGTSPGPLRTLNLALAKAQGHLRLEAGGDGFVWSWEGLGDSLDGPLWPVLRSAAELLASADIGRIRECAGDQCTWMFLDNSRAGTRRWCSMTSCGNRAKARRHYHRKS
jgi:predicted RNA-binding Zn ribbon-like protein